MKPGPVQVDEESSGRTFSPFAKLLWIAAGPSFALLLHLAFRAPAEYPLILKMAGLAGWMAIWWISEVIPLGVTSLIPFVFLPLLGISSAKDTAAQYMDEVIFLFLGGFFLSIAIEKWNLHRRIALGILSKTGSRPAGILIGVMLSAYLVSAWISNTATAMALISAVIAVISQIESTSAKKRPALAVALLLGLGYACSIGGMATLVGTPPNMAFFRIYNQEFPDHHGMDFARWSLIGVPVSFLLLLACFFILEIFFLRKERTEKFDVAAFQSMKDKLGKMRFEEKVILAVFLVAALLWFTRPDLDLGSMKIRGWASLFPKSEFVRDSSVAVLAAILLFLIPARSQKNSNLLEWEDAKKIPIDILLLFGSGFALAKGFEDSGLNVWLASQLSFMKSAPLWLVVSGICLVVCVISEFASNIASIQLVLPVLVPLVKVMDIDPLTLMVPATFAASLGFMLPVATAPNTIVFSSGRIRTSQMMKAGAVLDLAGILIIVSLTLLMRGIWS